ncbi:GlsB/YeaQ/YmgE family stress response membrane protein [Paenibacillus spiritus]|uniref:GlsB/YeaQ/YmgE family stress response membrane protein n=1 Tax=Paenibacillus spiritus TaxID=2496557 RepID=A0A5J5G5F9_9BACL|nr:MULTISPECIES: GlsB/YeaQ/YmgE family stress response membrane protein [Paenibacillus]KAA9002115.1 GlsB/YeaQ/YmgE family stress response membrane protein [Paenibacillus spiritus]
MWGLLISLIMAIIIGIIGDAIAGGKMPGGIIGSMVAGFIGAWLGSYLFGSFGPVIGHFAVVPAVLGTALLVFILGLFSRIIRRAS